MERRAPGVSLHLFRAVRGGFAAYGAIVSLVGAALAVALLVTGESVPLDDWRFWLMAALVLVGELLPIDVPRRDGARPRDDLDRVRVRDPARCSG